MMAGGEQRCSYIMTSGNRCQGERGHAGPHVWVAPGTKIELQVAKKKASNHG